MYNSTWMLALLLTPSLVLSARLRRAERALTDEEAVTVDKMIEVRSCYIYSMLGTLCEHFHLQNLHSTLRDDYVSPVLYGIIDAIEEAGGDIVYTTATGRRVRRRRCVEAVEGVFVDNQDHSIVNLHIGERFMLM